MARSLTPVQVERLCERAYWRLRDGDEREDVVSELARSLETPPRVAEELLAPYVRRLLRREL